MTRVIANTAVLLTLVLAFSAQSYAQEVKIGLSSSITFQGLSQSDNAETLPEIAPGFQPALGNLSGDFAVYDGARAYVAMFISSKHHTEMWGYEGYFEMRKLPDWMKLGKFGTFFDDHLKVKAGQFTIDYGDGLMYKTINGDAYNNDLIGNPVPTPALTALGMETTVSYGLANAMLGISNGTTKGDTQVGKGLALHGKVSVTPMEGLVRLSGSFYRVDHSGNGSGYPVGGTKSYLYAFGDRAGSSYDIWAGPDGGQLAYGKGQDVTAFQFDGRINLGTILVYGAVGTFSDGDMNGTVNGEDNGNPEDRWNYATATARYNLTDWLYAAGRFSTSRAVKLAGVDADGQLNRYQLGLGFYLYEGVLMKAEYVKQTTSNFAEGYTNNGVDLGIDPTFNGVLVQAVVKI